MRAAIVLLALASCATPRDVAVRALNVSSVSGAAAVAALDAAYRRDVKEPGARERYAPAYAAYRAYRAAWVAAAATAEGEAGPRVVALAQLAAAEARMLAAVKGVVR